MKELLQSEKALRAALKDDPGLITKQDETGRTLLHHAAKIALTKGSIEGVKILNILFNAPGLDLSIKDNKGNTPVHVVALCCSDKLTSQYVFHNFLQAAEKCKFDFSMLGEDGKSVLQIATIKSTYMEPDKILGRINNTSKVLRHVTHPGLNVLSRSGATAFFYAVKRCYFEEATMLLEAGADPTLFRSADRDPLVMIDRHLNKFNQGLTQDEYAAKHASFKWHIDQLNTLKNKLRLLPSVKKYAEIKENARIIAQASRTGTGPAFFKDMPSELQAKIAGFTGNLSVHNKKRSESIAAGSLYRPPVA